MLTGDGRLHGSSSVFCHPRPRLTGSRTGIAVFIRHNLLAQIRNARYNLLIGRTDNKLHALDIRTPRQKLLNASRRTAWANKFGPRYFRI